VLYKKVLRLLGLKQCWSALGAVLAYIHLLTPIAEQAAAIYIQSVSRDIDWSFISCSGKHFSFVGWLEKPVFKNFNSGQN